MSGASVPNRLLIINQDGRMINTLFAGGQN